MLLQNKRIVYIEDEARNRTIVEMLLKAEGAKIWFERWGVPNLSVSTIMAFWPLDLILLDLMLPNGYTGYDVYAELRKQSMLDDVPIVIVSAADASIEMPKARRLGLTSYLSKPIDADQFPQQIKAILDGQAIW